MCAVDVDSTGNHCRYKYAEFTKSQEMDTYLPRHQTKASKSTDTKDSLPTELYSDQAKRFIARGDQCEIST